MAMKPPYPYTNIARGEALDDRLPHGMNLATQKMGMHEWSFSNNYDPGERRLMPHVDLKERSRRSILRSSWALRLSRRWKKSSAA
ncbi:MAG: hypothetical protein U5K38_12295 [Woeseiaceae bacterium]|nr:hypothetical protein [Woeseiaceae bacterium]